MASSVPRTIARKLLEFAHRVSPDRSREWGEAMLAELEYVEGGGRVLAWSFGSSSVLLRQTLLDFVFPRRAAGGGGSPEWNPEERNMRKLILGFCAASLVTVLLLLLAPSFRQALDVSATGWRFVLDQPAISQARIQRLAEKARRERDAELMAFAAMRLPPGDASLQLAHEAVKLDPGLTWTYFVLARSMPPGPARDELTARLKAWDPENAVPYLLETSLTAQTPAGPPFVNANQLESTPQWRRGMEAIFSASKYDSYLSTRLNLERSVMRRHGLDDPMMVLEGIAPAHPLPALLLVQTYARHVLHQGQEKEAAGRFDEAWQSYWSVARFGHLMNSQGEMDFERLGGAMLRREAFEELRALAERTGDQKAAALLSVQGPEVGLLRERVSDHGLRGFAAVRLAAFVQMASLGILASLGVLFAAALGWLRRRMRPAPSQGSPWWLTAAASVGATGLAISSLILYLSYGPFADDFSHFMHGSGTRGAESLFTFYAFAEPFFYFRGLFEPQSKLWYFLLVGAAVLLIVELFRVTRGMPKARVAE